MISSTRSSSMARSRRKLGTVTSRSAPRAFAGRRRPARIFLACANGGATPRTRFTRDILRRTRWGLRFRGYASTTPRAIAPPASSAMSAATRAVAGPGATHDYRPVGDGLVVVGVQRLAELPEDVVSGVHDVTDGAKPDRAQPRPEPARRGADGDAVDDARREPMAQVRRLDAHARERSRGLTRLLQRDRRQAEARAGECRQLARDAHDGEAVGPIRGDLDLEHVVVEAERRDQVSAGPGAVEKQDSRLVLLADPELTLRAEHALRLGAVDLRGGDPAAACQDGAGGREGGAGADLGVRRAAHHGVALTPGAHAAQEQRMAIVALAELALDRLDL